MKKTFIIVGIILIVLVVAVIIFFNVSFISKNEVKELVLKHAGLKESDVIRWNIELNNEDGNWEYDVEYVFNNLEYTYEIDAKTGNIIIFGIDS